MKLAIKIIDWIMFLVCCLAALIWIVLFIGLFFNLQPTESLIRFAFLFAAFWMISATIHNGKDVFK